MSSFSFIDAAPEAESGETSAPLSGFGFVVEAAAFSDHSTAVEHVHHSQTFTTEALTLPKAASAKQVVKKKKKAARVGFGREDGGDEEDNGHSAVDAIAHAHHEFEERATVADHADARLQPSSIQESALPSSVEEGAAESSGFGFMSHVSEDETPAVPPPAPPLELLTILESQPAELDETIREYEIHEQAPPTPVTDIPHHYHDQISLTDAGSAPAPAPEHSDVIALSEYDPQLAGDILSMRESFADAAESLDFVAVVELLKLSKVSLNLVLSAGERFMQEANRQRCLTQEIEQSHASVLALSTKIEDLEQLQATCARQERFEQADQLSTDISVAQADLENAKLRQCALQNHLQEQSALCTQARSQLLHCFCEFGTHVGDHSERAAHQIGAAREMLGHARHEDDKRIEAALKRSEMERSHYDREQLALQADTAIVEDAIKLEVGDQYEKKVAMEIELESLQGEIRAMEETLATKRREEARMLRVLQADEAKISEARKKYDRQLQRIGDRHRDLIQAQAECGAELQALEGRKSQLADKFGGFFHTLDSIESRLQHDTVEAVVARRLSDDLRSLAADDESEHLQNALLALKLDDDAMLAESFALASYTRADQFLLARAGRKAAAKQCAEAVARAGELSAQFEAVKAELLAVSDATARLEAEKKVLASSKKFKEAGIVAKDIKDLTVKKSELEQLNSALLVDIVATEKDKGDVEGVLGACDAAFVEQERAWFHVLYRKLHRRLWFVEAQAAKAQAEVVGVAQGAGSDFQSQLLCAANLVFEEELLRLRHLEDAMLSKYPAPEDAEIGDEPATAVGVEEFCAAAAPVVEELEIATGQEVPVEIVEFTVEQEQSSAVLYEVAESVDNHPPEPRPSAELLQQMEEEISRLEEEIQQAADHEDYDKASELQDVVDAKKDELQRLQQL